MAAMMQIHGWKPERSQRLCLTRRGSPLVTFTDRILMNNELRTSGWHMKPNGGFLTWGVLLNHPISRDFGGTPMAMESPKWVDAIIRSSSAHPGRALVAPSFSSAQMRWRTPGPSGREQQRIRSDQRIYRIHSAGDTKSKHNKGTYWITEHNILVLPTYHNWYIDIYVCVYVYICIYIYIQISQCK